MQAGIIPSHQTQKMHIEGNAPICTLYIALENKTHVYIYSAIYIYIYIFFFSIQKTDRKTTQLQLAAGIRRPRCHLKSVGNSHLDRGIWLLGLIANRWLTTTNLSYRFSYSWNFRHRLAYLYYWYYLSHYVCVFVFVYNFSIGTNVHKLILK